MEEICAVGERKATSGVGLPFTEDSRGGWVLWESQAVLTLRDTLPGVPAPRHLGWKQGNRTLLPCCTTALVPCLAVKKGTGMRSGIIMHNAKKLN